MTTHRDGRPADGPQDEADVMGGDGYPESAWRDAVVVSVGREPSGEPLMGAVLDLVHDLDQQVSHLKAALATNRRIGIAIGIVMSQFRIGEDDAFITLRHVSQNTNRKLRDVAEDVIYSGHLAVGR